MIAVIFLLGCICWYGIYIFSALNANYTEYLSDENLYKVNMDKLTYNVYDELQPGSEYSFQEFSDYPINKLFYVIYSNTLNRSLFFLLPLASFYLIYQAFKTEQYDKNIYGVSNWYLIITIGYFLMLAFMFFWVTDYLFTKDFKDQFKPETNLEIINTQQISGKGKLIAGIGKNEFYWLKSEVLDTMFTFQLTKWANIAMVGLLFLITVFSVLLIFLKPKADRKKIQKIQKEIKKKAEANIQGEEYEMDQSIFQ